ATHSVDIDLPSSESPPPDVIVEPIINKLVLTQDNRILWNAEEINQGQLVSLLQDSLTLSVEPELQFEPEAQASYDLSAKVINIIKASGVTKFGFVGNEKYRVFGTAGAQ
ncbi:MAG: biopolymer transporter ExbD, partial [Erythrobacter sp.]|nr:biopolymer transporter ExbD [Erythrobacter sp.]